MSWSSVTFFLCLYGFLKELRPSEPFLTEYLIDQNYVNITLQEVMQFSISIKNSVCILLYF